MAVEVRVLGPVEAMLDGRPIDLGGRRPRQVLAGLALDAGRPVSTERLVDLVWSHDPPASARTQIAIQISALRRALGDGGGLIGTTADGYRLGPDGVWVDAGEAARAQDTSAEPERAEEAVGRLRTALGLWRGQPFAGLLTPGLEAASQSLQHLRTSLAEDLYARELELGRCREVLSELRALVLGDPLHERFAELLMTALWRSGQTAAALEVFGATRAMLVDQLGIEPNAGLCALQQRILGAETPEPLPSSTSSCVVPAQLPSALPDFVGRSADLEALGHVVEDESRGVRLVVVSGTAGVGKTTLVTHWAHTVREQFPDGQLYVDLQGFSPDDPVPPHQTLGAFLRALGEANNAVPEDLAERAGRFRTILDGRRLLIVLDNASSPDQVRPLLPGGGSSLVVVTSRSTLRGLISREGAHALPLGPLNDEEARSVLSSRVGPAAGASGPAGRLIDYCSRIPLALRVAGDRLRDGGAQQIADLVDQLETDEQPLDLLDTGDEQTSMRAVLSWSYRQLSPEAAHLFRLCGFWCGHTAHRIDLRGMGALLDADLSTARRLTSEVVRFGLADEHPGEYFSMHPLIQAYASELSARFEVADAQVRLVSEYVRTAVSATSFIRPRERPLLSQMPVNNGRPGLSDLSSAVRWLDAQRPSLLCAVELTANDGLHAHTVDLATTLWPYLERGEHIEESARIHSLGRSAAQSLEDRTAEGIVVRALGIHELQLEHFGHAEELLQEALDLHSSDEDAPLRETTMDYLAAISRS